MNLKQLQAEWLGSAETDYFAEALTPHILQQERDRDLIRRLFKALSIESDDTFDEKVQLWEEARARIKEMESD